MKKVVLIYSGGLDSTVLLYHLRASSQGVTCVGFNYGQRHLRELEGARSICAALDTEFVLADMGSLNSLLEGSALTRQEIRVPHGHYTDESMKVTVVPNRNMIMLSVALGLAISRRADSVAYGAHRGDHTIYPDCRSEFIEAMNRAAGLCDWRKVEVLAPFAELTKSDIVRRGFELGVPFEQTWSCYEGGSLHCGLCGTCVERREAFVTAGIADPTEYVVEGT